ncbi:MAG: esterase family protein, partial [Defluviitaleaceae bacterium]|nr:esterase family protein [Defluviitaleaceae bacterium]
QIRLLVTCGVDDFLIEENRKFNEHAKALPIDFEYKEWDGEHNWKFWEECLPLALDFFEGKK